MWGSSPGFEIYLKIHMTKWKTIFTYSNLCIMFFLFFFHHRTTRYCKNCSVYIGLCTGIYEMSAIAHMQCNVFLGREKVRQEEKNTLSSFIPWLDSCFSGRFLPLYVLLAFLGFSEQILFCKILPIILLKIRAKILPYLSLIVR